MLMDYISSFRLACLAKTRSAQDIKIQLFMLSVVQFFDLMLGVTMIAGLILQAKFVYNGCRLQK